MFAALFDERLKVVVSSCGLDQFVDYYGGGGAVWMPEKGWSADAVHAAAGGDIGGSSIRFRSTFLELVGVLAARHIFHFGSVCMIRTFRHDSVDRVVAAATPGV